MTLWLPVTILRFCNESGDRDDEMAETVPTGYAALTPTHWRGDPVLSDEVVRLSVVGRIVRRRWRLFTVVAAAGALLGAGTSLLLAPGYESASRVLLQSSEAEEALETEAQIATSSVVLDRTAAALGPGVTTAQLRGSVSAEAGDGSIITINGAAATPDRAQQLTERVTQEYVAFSTQLVSGATADLDQALQQRRETLTQRIADSNGRIADLRGSATAGSELDRQRTTLADATAELDDLDEQEAATRAALRTASIVVMEPAGLPTSRAQPTPVQFIAGGALLFLLLGVSAHLIAARADQRLTSAPEIASALGSPVVGSVDVPLAHDRRSRPRNRRSRLWRLVRDARPWDEPLLPSSDDVTRELRCRRALEQLRRAPGTDLRLLVLVPDDDPHASRAAALLAVAAGMAGRPASVLTDRAAFSELVHATAARAATSSLRLTIRASSDPAPATDRTVLRVIDVSAAMPTVPDCGRVAGALVVATAGTRTPWELVGIAEACADAGYPVVGALVTHRSRPGDDKPGRPTQPNSRETSSNGKAMAGSP